LSTPSDVFRLLAILLLAATFLVCRARPRDAQGSNPVLFSSKGISSPANFVLMSAIDGLGSATRRNRIPSR
jgi:hypothetical protein